MSGDTRNNFKRLADEDEMKPRDDKQINGTVSFISSISRVIELYLPGFFQLMISISGGGDDVKKKSGPPNSNSGLAKRDNEHGPSAPPK